MKTIVAIVAAATLWPAILSAADVKTEVKWKKDIAACVQEVHRLQYDSKEFDAYAKPGFRVAAFGTEQEKFQFGKCMTEKGWSLGDAEEK